jgi:hypothetical protein
MAEQANNHRRGPRRERAWRVAALILTVVVASIGCDPVQTLNFILTPFSDAAIDPDCPLTIPNKESKVVVLAAPGDVEPNLQFKGADDILCRRLIALLDERFKEHKDKVKIVPFTKVAAYRNKHPDWLTQSKRDIGKYFEADFVLYLELGPMAMYEKGSNGLLYRGSVEINMTLVDVNQDEGEGTKFQDIYSCMYPTHGPEDATAMSPARFQANFMEHVAKDLLIQFAPHETRDKVESGGN